MATHPSSVRRFASRLALISLLATFALLSGQGCPSARPSNIAPEITTPTVAGTLVPGQAGSIVVSCAAVDPDGSVASVQADLSALGGSPTQDLSSADGLSWTWSGWVAPSTAGTITITLSATDNASAVTTTTASLAVRTADAATLVLDLGNAIAIELIRIPAGSFAMGTNSTDVITFYQVGVTDPVTDNAWSNAARPVHQVTFTQPFYMGKYALTQAQWNAVMGTASAQDGQGPQYPASSISWDNAVAFCQALATQTGRTVRLPSEAEWEYACKAGSGDTAYSFGDDTGQLSQYAWYHDNSGQVPQPVGQKLPNAFGLYDMHGNVWEWCQDLWHDNYNAAPSDGSVWSAGGQSGSHPLRGGSCANTAGPCRSAYRNSFPANSHYTDFGFRIVIP